MTLLPIPSVKIRAEFSQLKLQDYQRVISMISQTYGQVRHSQFKQ